MTFEQLLTKFDGITAVLIFIMATQLIPFLKDRVWPNAMKRKEAENMLRRQSDQQLLLLKEREVSAQEQIGSVMVMIAERMTQLEQNQAKHEARAERVTTQSVEALSAIQTSIQMLLYRELDNTKKKGETKQ